jgi:2-oxoglutarate ferredoxin oxidoreductase subunit beta
MTAKKLSLKNYLRGLKLPFCPGCGCFTVMNCFLRAVQQAGYRDFRKFVFCSGIGCAAWIPSPYFKADSIHVTHGRSVPVATGVKLMRPDLNVVVFGGDGDLLGIGLSHLIHAARRNLDVSVVMVNNMVYGMTGGQVAPTTPLKVKTTTTPYGSFERPFDVVRLVVSAGASYAARWTTAHVKELEDAFKAAIEIRGFAFVEVVSQCPTMFGRRVGFKSVGEMLQRFKEKSVPLKEAEKMGEDELVDKVVVGEFARLESSTLTERFQEMLKEPLSHV